MTYGDPTLFVLRKMLTYFIYMPFWKVAELNGKKKSRLGSVA